MNHKAKNEKGSSSYCLGYLNWKQQEGDHMDERLKRQLDFALEIDKEKNIFRQTHLSGQGGRGKGKDLLHSARGSEAGAHRTV